MKTVALIDADTLVYSAALASEVPIEWQPDLWTLHSDLETAVRQFHALLDGIKEAVKPARIIMALSDADSTRRWRNTFMPEYKSQRKKTRRPLVYAPLRQWVHDTFETFERPTLEGDDILGILATSSIIDGDKVIVSIDKDMKTVPGRLFNYGKDTAISEISADEADYNHLLQTLTGDTTDGYPGCPGVGPKSAAKLLQPIADDPDWPRAWAIVVAAYKKAGLSEEVALQNARVARILRASDYNFKTKEVIPWTPASA